MTSLDKKYFFSDFTERHYIQLLKMAKKYYSFELFTTKQKKPHVIWRHDVDMSIHRALKLAEIEARLGIKSTYFLLLHSEFYNIFEKDVYEKIKKILKLGHKIGLHFEFSFYKIKNFKQLEKYLKFEKEILEKTFSTKIDVFSFHNPELGYLDSLSNNSIEGMKNCYGKFFKNNYFYCSDSNGYWRFERLFDILSEHEHDQLHILIHPEWWQKKSMSPKDRVNRCIDFRAKSTKKSYDDFIRKNKRKNIGIKND